MRRCESASATETEALGAELAVALQAGDAVVVQGELGAGKTTFVRGACRALGVTAVVSSPTFTIGQRYAAPTPISHLDLFRVANLFDEDPDLVGDYLGPDTISFVELPAGRTVSARAIESEIARFARPAAWVVLAHAGADRRVVEIK